MVFLPLGGDQLSDPYCVVYLNGVKLFSTDYVQNTLDPSWESTPTRHPDKNCWHEVLVANYHTAWCEFRLFDYDALMHDQYMGSVRLDLSKVYPREPSLILKPSLWGPVMVE